MTQFRSCGSGNEPKPVSELLDVNAAAGYLSVTPRWMRRAVSERRLPYYRLGGRIRFLRADLEAYVDSCRQDGGQQ